MRKALLSIFLLSVVLSPGIAFAEDVQECQGTEDSYCTKINERVEQARKDKKEPDLSGIHQPPGKTCICNPLQTENFTDIVDNILGILFNFALVLAPIMIVVAGIMFVTAGGSPDRVSTAKRILIWTVVGLGIIILARGLIAVLQRIIGF